MYNTQLETFIKVADAGSFSKAGEELYITPTAVIKQINTLENRLGLQLFIRTHRGLTLTEAGKSLYKDAKYIIKYSRQSVERARKINLKNRNTVRLGTSPMTSEKKLIEIWNKVRDEKENIKIQIIPFENTPENAREILNNMGKDIDIVVGIYDEILLGSRNCTATNLFDEPLRCAVSINHKLAAKEILTYEDLYGENIMLIHRGWNKAMDELRSETTRNHPEISIEDFDFFDLGIFNKCENGNDVLIIADNFEGVHPLLKIIPVKWEFSTPFGIIHSTDPTEIVKEFIKKIKDGMDSLSKYSE